MAAKPLPDQSVLLQILRYDGRTGKLYWRNHPNQNVISGKEALTCLTDKGYKRGKILNQNFMAHRVIWKMLYGTEPDEVDHRNGNRSDNKKRNLREADRQFNNRNSALRPSNKSGRIGVHKRGNRWLAGIRHDGKHINLGSFIFKEDAIKARETAEIKFGYDPQHGRKRRY